MPSDAAMKKAREWIDAQDARGYVPYNYAYAELATLIDATRAEALEEVCVEIGRMPVFARLVNGAFVDDAWETLRELTVRVRALAQEPKR